MVSVTMSKFGVCLSEYHDLYVNGISLTVDE